MLKAQNNAEQATFAAMSDCRKLEMDTPPLVVHPSRSLNKQKEPIVNEDGTPNMLGLLVYYSRCFTQQATPEQAKLVADNVHEFGLDQHEANDIPLTDEDTAREGLLLTLERQTVERESARFAARKQVAIELAKASLAAAVKVYGADSEYAIAAQLHLEDIDR